MTFIFKADSSQERPRLGFQHADAECYNSLKDYLLYQGITNLTGSWDATRAAFKNGLIEQGEDWMKMIAARNKTSHTYNLNVATAVAEDILNRFYPALANMAKKFTELSERQDIDP